MHCSVAEVCAAALQEMNPLVKVKVRPGALDATDLSFLASYQVPDVAAVCRTDPAVCNCICHYLLSIATSACKHLYVT